MSRATVVWINNAGFKVFSVRKKIIYTFILCFVFLILLSLFLYWKSYEYHQTVSYLKNSNLALKQERDRNLQKIEALSKKLSQRTASLSSLKNELSQSKRQLQRLQYIESKMREKKRKLNLLISKYEELKKKYRMATSINCTITAYSPSRHQTDDTPHQTAILQKPVSGWTAAVSPDLKGWLGKKVYIEGFGIRKINDLMHPRFEQAVDIFVGSAEAAKKIGKSKAEVVLLDDLNDEQTREEMAFLQDSRNF